MIEGGVTYGYLYKDGVRPSSTFFLFFTRTEGVGDTGWNKKYGT